MTQFCIILICNYIGAITSANCAYIKGTFTAENLAHIEFNNLILGKAVKHKCGNSHIDVEEPKGIPEIRIDNHEANK